MARGGQPGGQQLNFESGSSGTRPGLESIEGGKYSMCPLLPFCFLATVCVFVLSWRGLTVKGAINMTAETSPILASAVV